MFVYGRRNDAYHPWHRGKSVKKWKYSHPCSSILEGAQSEGAAGAILFLDDLDVHECNGCHACWEGKECSKHDDMNSIYPQIIKSHGIIFGTSVYWDGPTALMKGFVNRFV